MTEASTKISNTAKAVAGVILTAAFLGAISWASWTTLSLITVQTQLAALNQKIDGVKETKQSDDRRHELDADKLERRLASIESKLDRALGLISHPEPTENIIRNHNENTVLVHVPDGLAEFRRIIEFNKEYHDGLRARITDTQ